MVALRTIYEVFAADQAGLVGMETFNGRVSTKDRATGRPVRPSDQGPRAAGTVCHADALCDLMEEVQFDAKQRKFIWPDGQLLDLDQSVQHIQKQYPDFRSDWIEEYLSDSIDMDYAPEPYSQAQLDELDRLTARWIADHMRRAKTSKNRRELVTLEEHLSR
jgi:hypothetical protein